MLMKAVEEYARKWTRGYPTYTSVVILFWLSIVNASIDEKVDSFEFKCPSLTHWNYRAAIVCNNTDNYRCLWDINDEQYIEQCGGTEYVRKGFRRVFAGSTTKDLCTGDKYQPFRYTTEGNYDCVFDRFKCNEIGQIVYDHGHKMTDRTCRCNHSAGYTFLHRPKHRCYCEPAREDCTCVIGSCPEYRRLDKDYTCRPYNDWKVEFECKDPPACFQCVNMATKNPIVSLTENENDNELQTTSLVSSDAAVVVLVLTCFCFVFLLGASWYISTRTIETVQTETEKEIKDIKAKGERRVAMLANAIQGEEAVVDDPDKRRWVTIGVALNSILCPHLRRYTYLEMQRLWEQLESQYSISTQQCPPVLTRYVGRYLNYQAINGNENHGKQEIRNSYNPNYDFKIKTAADLAKLFLPLRMSHMTGFDNTCDCSAVLNIISGCSLEPMNEANQVRQKVRNPWGHCNFKEWTSTKFEESFGLMSALVNKLPISGMNTTAAKTKVLDELKKYEDGGLYMFDSAFGFSLRKDLREAFHNDIMILKAIQIRIDKRLEEVESKIGFGYVFGF